MELALAREYDDDDRRGASSAQVSDWVGRGGACRRPSPRDWSKGDSVVVSAAQVSDCAGGTGPTADLRPQVGDRGESMLPQPDAQCAAARDTTRRPKTVCVPGGY